MKFSTLFALMAAGLAQAQVPDIPQCSLQCFISAFGSDGCSSLLDFGCHCQKTELIGSIAPCVQKACKIPEQISVSNVVVAQCSSAGHPISVPPVVTTTPSVSTTETSFSSSTPTETSATPTATVSATGRPGAAESSTAGLSSTSSRLTVPGSSTNVGSSTVGGSTVGGSTGATTSIPLGTKTGSASASASVSSLAYNGAAAYVKSNFVGVAIVVAGVAYVL